MSFFYNEGMDNRCISLVEFSSNEIFYEVQYTRYFSPFMHIRVFEIFGNSNQKYNTKRENSHGRLNRLHGSTFFELDGLTICRARGFDKHISSCTLPCKRKRVLHGKFFKILSPGEVTSGQVTMQRNATVNSVYSSLQRQDLSSPKTSGSKNLEN